MAACKSVLVLCPRGRRQTVKTTPSMTILQILEEVCKKQGISSQEYALKHQRKILDATIPVRYSGITNNAHLELVPSTKSNKLGGKCTVALQVESGERLMKDFEPEATLWDVLTYWDMQQDSPHQGTIRTQVERSESGVLAEIQLAPVCVYMSQEIHGEENLRKQSLHSLGLTGQRAVIRLLHRPLDQKESPNAQQGDKNLSVSLPVVDRLPADEPMELEQNREKSRGDICCTSANSASVSDNKPVAGMRRKSPAEQETKEPKIPKTFGQKPTFPDFKFPERTSEQVGRGDQCENTVNDRTDSPCERHAVVFKEDDPSSPTHQQVELPDSFFEVTVDDIRKMLQDLRNESESSEAPLMTSALRAIQRQTEIDKYSRVVIRVKFPDRLIIQGIFRPRERVSALTEFVKSHLQEPNKKFYLYTTPPKAVLKNQEDSLFEAKLCPASLVYFGSSDHHEPFLSSQFTDNLSTSIDADKLLVETGTRTVRQDKGHSAERPDVGQRTSSVEPSGAGLSTGTSGGASGVQNGTSSAKPRRTDTDKPVPKWFKGTGRS